ncbi:4a-hydroxytetrahydrobiopterin dehydratase [Lipingzhangella sp. LS1_29]|uniref:Putative pterin-4-alpha-carbinolamine dehydratase n=1 Tax=Lipingzhangella rawalii TaxID=2055835 RepID=A0ABU2H1Q7_9ACTN|nr:4a-hydroxytetrahydrobiopterin dehydratase [Lipingzhangella rawalii]MDS1268800.1 4a-hydroxytetrahydrobiopterin dehydratase [Lipingzhangella rawalii]
MADELLDHTEVDRVIGQVEGWQRSGDRLVRTWQVKGFNGAVQLANVVAYVANRRNHHPDITVHDYNQVTVSVTTHDAGGLTRHDVALARAINDTLETSERE